MVKIYKSDKAALALTVKLEGGALDTIHFVGGQFATEDEVEQKAIESSDLFASKHIVLVPPPDPRAALAAEVESTAKAAAEAQKAADVAKAEVDAFLGRPKALQAQADQAAGAAKLAAQALADFDKKAEPASAAA